MTVAVAAGGRKGRALAALAAALVAGISPAVVSAPAVSAGSQAGVFTNYQGTGIAGPLGLTTGPDGSVWFTNSNNNSIGRITTAGVISNYTDPTISHPVGIALASDGALWFTNAPGVGGTNSIGRITTAGIVTNFTNPTIFPTGAITAGPDGALWFANVTDPLHDVFSIGRITTTGRVKTFPLGNNPYLSPMQITAGPDGALWFAAGGSIGRMTTAGQLTVFPSGLNQLFGITAGPDGALWYIGHSQAFLAAVGRMTPTGARTLYPAAGTNITVGPDGAFWFADSGNNSTPPSINRITTKGTVTSYPGDQVLDKYLVNLTAGPNGGIWFTARGNILGQVSTADHVLASPSQGRAGTPLTITGGGFSTGEPVTVRYQTGLVSPASVQLCATTAAGDGTFSCTTHVPPTSGGLGTHGVKATGKASGTKAAATFLLTS
jgi:virginiamycin B lyase